MASTIRPEHSFLVRLRVLLQETPQFGHQIVVSWLSHGKAFLIHDRPYFTSKILPAYFNTKFASFRQTLRNHGFVQMGGSGWDAGCYYHKLFSRDEPELCHGLTQQQMKEAMPGWVPALEEPDFYSSLVKMANIASATAIVSFGVNSEFSNGSSLTSSEDSGNSADNEEQGSDGSGNAADNDQSDFQFPEWLKEEAKKKHKHHHKKKKRSAQN